MIIWQGYNYTTSIKTHRTMWRGLPVCSQFACSGRVYQWLQQAPVGSGLTCTGKVHPRSQPAPVGKWNCWYHGNGKIPQWMSQAHGVQNYTVLLGSILNYCIPRFKQVSGRTTHGASFTIYVHAFPIAVGNARNSWFSVGSTSVKYKDPQAHT